MSVGQDTMAAMQPSPVVPLASWSVSVADATAALARVLDALAGPTAVPKPDQLEVFDEEGFDLTPTA